MNGYNFTDDVRQSLMLARVEAARHRHEYVGTEHVLLGLIDVPECAAPTLLKEFGFEPERIRSAIEELIGPGHSTVSNDDLPYTSRAKKVLELAMHEARIAGHTYVGTEHLLLGLMREQNGIAAQVLASAGVDAETLRAEVVRRVSAGTLPTGARARARASFEVTHTHVSNAASVQAAATVDTLVTLARRAQKAAYLSAVASIIAMIAVLVSLFR